MVAKVSIGSSFKGCLKYLYEGHKQSEPNEKQAQVLQANGVRTESLETLTRDFNRGRLQNADLKKAVWHTALAFHPQDSAKVDNEKMIQIAKSYMERLKIDPEKNQWVLIRHHDKEHSHVHLVVNRVSPGGATVSDQFCKDRSKEAAEKISREYGLTVASEKAKDLNLTHVKAMPGHDQARYTILASITEALPQSKSLEELTQKLKESGIQTKTQQTKEGKLQGITFELDGHYLKGSQIDRQCSAGNLVKALEGQNQHQKQSLVEQLRARLSKAYEISDLKERLQSAYKRQEEKKQQEVSQEKKVSPEVSKEGSTREPDQSIYKHDRGISR